MSDTDPLATAENPAGPLLPEAEPMDVQAIREALVIRERDLFLLTDKAGEVPAGNISGYGLYFADTRYLSMFEFSLAERKSMVLLSIAELGYSSEHVLTNYAMTDLDGREVPSATIQVHRTPPADCEADIAGVVEVCAHSRPSSGRRRGRPLLRAAQ